jgi:hypothetical protein
MSTLYFEQTKPNAKGEHKRYKVISFDDEKGTVKLQGLAPEGFEEIMDRERFEKMGYKLIQVEE